MLKTYECTIEKKIPTFCVDTVKMHALPVYCAMLYLVTGGTLILVSPMKSASLK